MPCLSSTTRRQRNSGKSTVDFDLCSRSPDKFDNDSATTPDRTPSIADSAHLGGGTEPPNHRRILTEYMHRRRQRLQQLNEWHGKNLDSVTGSSDIDCPPPPVLESHPDDVYFRSFRVLTFQVLDSRSEDKNCIANKQIN